MMKEYILDTTTPKPVRIFSETFKEHLGETHGLYQEDVIKLHCTLQEYPPHGDAADEVVDACKCQR
jgi:hypothetical protein